MKEIKFTVYGTPATQGSKIRTQYGVREDNPKLSQWRQQVAEVAKREYSGEPFTGRLSLSLIFHRPRSRSDYGTGKNADKLKASAPLEPTKRPDLTKLTRAVEDAMTGIIYHDDSQITHQIISKVFGSPACVEVTVIRHESNSRTAAGGE